MYFVQQGHDGPIKIGWAGNPGARLRELAVGNPMDLHLVGALPGSVAAERAAQSRFADSHIRGEWFRPTPELLAVARLSHPPPWWPSGRALPLDELRAIAREIERLAADLHEAAELRDRLIVEATRAGASRREVAAAAGVTAGRVQQILARGPS